MLQNCRIKFPHPSFEFPGLCAFIWDADRRARVLTGRAIGHQRCHLIEGTPCMMIVDTEIDR